MGGPTAWPEHPMHAGRILESMSTRCVVRTGLPATKWIGMPTREPLHHERAISTSRMQLCTEVLSLLPASSSLRPGKNGRFGGSVSLLQHTEVLKMLFLWNKSYFHKGLMTIVCGFYFAWLQTSTQCSLTGPGMVPSRWGEWRIHRPYCVPRTVRSLIIDHKSLICL